MAAERSYTNAVAWGGFGQRIPLGPDEIHLWLVRHDAIVEPALRASYFKLMSDAECAQETRFHFERDRRRYLVTRALLRSVLSRYASNPPCSWTFETNEYGRPEVADVWDLSFNLSHSDTLVVLSVRRGGSLGVDVEDLAIRRPPLEIAGDYFGPHEIADLASLPPVRRLRRFFEFWTFKESYIKARGMGLSLPLDGFEFSFPNERSVRISICEDLMDDPARWRFWQFETALGHLIALCAERSGEESMPTVCCFEAVPLRSERILSMRASRTSE